MAKNSDNRTLNLVDDWNAYRQTRRESVEARSYSPFEVTFILKYGRNFRRSNGDRIKYLDRMDIPPVLQQSRGYLSGSIVVLSENGNGTRVTFFRNGRAIELKLGA